jgi:hypothetical protein
MHPSVSGRRVRMVTLVTALLTAGSAAAADSFIRGGNEFVANTYTPYAQIRPDVASVPDGRFIVVWERLASPDIHGQRFAPGAAKAGGEFVVNGDTQTGFVNEPSVSAAADGSFVVVWEGYVDNPIFNGYWIQAQRHSSTGVRLGGQFTVNDTRGTDYRQSVASAPDGAFVVVWTSYGPYSGGDDADVRARFFDNTGAPLGGDFFVNTYTTGEQRDQSVARAANGNVVVVWSDPGRDSVLARRFDGAGVAQGDEFAVTTSAGFLTDPRVAAAPDGRFVIVWRGYPGADIIGRRYDAAGVPQGGEFVVNAQTTGYQTTPDVSVADDGTFAVAWVREDAYSDVFARRFDASGVPAGDDFQVNELRHGSTGYFPSLSLSGPGDGTFVVTWTSDYGYGYPDPATDIMGARLVGGSVGCTPAPKSPCRGVTVGNQGIFRFKDAVNPKSDRLVWNWVKGEATAPGDFGNPLSNTAFALCLYDASASPQPVAEVRSTAQGPCRKGVLCWTALSNSPTLRYYDGDKTSDGLQQILLRSGGAGQARIGVRAGGPRLTLPPTPLTPPLVVQLQGSNDVCWTATYSTLLTNAGGVVRAKPDGP